MVGFFLPSVVASSQTKTYLCFSISTFISETKSLIEAMSWEIFFRQKKARWGAGEVYSRGVEFGVELRLY